MSVKVTLQGDGLNYETEASVIQAAKIIGFLNTQEPLAAEYSDAPKPTFDPNSFLGQAKSQQTSSPREAIIQSGAKTNVQKIVVLGQYIIERDSTDEFGSNELKTLFLKAGEPAPRNLARDMRDAVLAGFVTESSERSDTYIVTNTGMTAISEGFALQSNRVIRRKKKTSSGSVAGKRMTLEPEWLKAVTVSDQLDEFPSYRKMKTRSQKILWILQWAKNNSKDNIGGSDIIAIASKLGNNIPSKQIAASLSPYLSKSYISKSSDGYSMLYDGTEYLKTIEV